MPTTAPLQVSQVKAKRSRRKLNEEQVKDLHKRGLANSEIAKITGLNHVTVWKFLDSIKAESVQLARFKTHRADVFADLQGKALSLQHKLMDHLLGDGILESMDDKAKVSLANSINNVFGTAYDKERLERGQSTENHSIMHKILGSAFDGVHNPLITKGSDVAGK